MTIHFDDGDSGKYNGAKFRLMGIDAYETPKEGLNNVWDARGLLATAVAREIAAVQGSGNRDKYGRELSRPTAYEGDTDPRAKLIRAGLAGVNDMSELDDAVAFAEGQRRMNSMFGWEDDNLEVRELKKAAANLKRLQGGEAVVNTKKTYYKGPKPADPKRWEITKGFLRGLDMTQGMLYGFSGALGDVLGLQGLKEWGEKGADLNEYETLLNPARVASYNQVHGIGDAVDYAVGKTGEMIPMVAGAAAGAAVGAATAPVTGFGLGASALAGSFAVGTALNAGDAASDARRTGKTEGYGGASLIAGAAMGAIESYGLSKLFSTAMKGTGVGNAIAGETAGLLQRSAHAVADVITAAGKGFVIEGTTELAQEATKDVVLETIGGVDTSKLGNRTHRYAESFFGGGAGGFGLGGAGRAVKLAFGNEKAHRDAVRQRDEDLGNQAHDFNEQAQQVDQYGNVIHTHNHNHNYNPANVNVEDEQGNPVGAPPVQPPVTPAQPAPTQAPVQPTPTQTTTPTTQPAQNQTPVQPAPTQSNPTPVTQPAQQLETGWDFENGGFPSDPVSYGQARQSYPDDASFIGAVKKYVESLSDPKLNEVYSKSHVFAGLVLTDADAILKDEKARRDVAKAGNQPIQVPATDPATDLAQQMSTEVEVTPTIEAGTKVEEVATEPEQTTQTKAVEEAVIESEPVVDPQPLRDPEPQSVQSVQPKSEPKRTPKSQWVGTEWNDNNIRQSSRGLDNPRGYNIQDLVEGAVDLKDEGKTPKFLRDKIGEYAENKIGKTIGQIRSSSINFTQKNGIVAKLTSDKALHDNIRQWIVDEQINAAQDTNKWHSKLKKALANGSKPAISNAEAQLKVAENRLREVSGFASHFRINNARKLVDMARLKQAAHKTIVSQLKARSKGKLDTLQTNITEFEKLHRAGNVSAISEFIRKNTAIGAIYPRLWAQALVTKAKGLNEFTNEYQADVPPEVVYDRLRNSFPKGMHKLFTDSFTSTDGPRVELKSDPKSGERARKSIEQEHKRSAYDEEVIARPEFKRKPSKAKPTKDNEHAVKYIRKIVSHVINGRVKEVSFGVEEFFDDNGHKQDSSEKQFEQDGNPVYTSTDGFDVDNPSHFDALIEAARNADIIGDGTLEKLAESLRAHFPIEMVSAYKTILGKTKNKSKKLTADEIIVFANGMAKKAQEKAVKQLAENAKEYVTASVLARRLESKINIEEPHPNLQALVDKINGALRYPTDELNKLAERFKATPEQVVGVLDGMVEATILSDGNPKSSSIEGFDVIVESLLGTEHAVRDSINSARVAFNEVLESHKKRQPTQEQINYAADVIENEDWSSYTPAQIVGRLHDLGLISGTEIDYSYLEEQGANDGRHANVAFINRYGAVRDSTPKKHTVTLTDSNGKRRRLNIQGLVKAQMSILEKSNNGSEIVRFVTAVNDVFSRLLSYKDSVGTTFDNGSVNELFQSSDDAFLQGANGDSIVLLNIDGVDVTLDDFRTSVETLEEIYGANNFESNRDLDYNLNKFVGEIYAIASELSVDASRVKLIEQTQNEIDALSDKLRDNPDDSVVENNLAQKKAKLDRLRAKSESEINAIKIHISRINQRLSQLENNPETREEVVRLQEERESYQKQLDNHKKPISENQISKNHVVLDNITKTLFGGKYENVDIVGSYTEAIEVVLQNRVDEEEYTREALVLAKSNIEDVTDDIDKIITSVAELKRAKKNGSVKSPLAGKVTPADASIVAGKLKDLRRAYYNAKQINNYRWSTRHLIDKLAHITGRKRITEQSERNEILGIRPDKSEADRFAEYRLSGEELRDIFKERARAIELMGIHNFATSLESRVQKQRSVEGAKFVIQKVNSDNIENAIVAEIHDEEKGTQVVVMMREGTKVLSTKTVDLTDTESVNRLIKDTGSRPVFYHSNNGNIGRSFSNAVDIKEVLIGTDTFRFNTDLESAYGLIKPGMSGVGPHEKIASVVDGMLSKSDEIRKSINAQRAKTNVKATNTINGDEGVQFFRKHEPMNVEGELKPVYHSLYNAIRKANIGEQVHINISSDVKIRDTYVETTVGPDGRLIHTINAPALNANNAVAWLATVGHEVGHLVVQPYLDAFNKGSLNVDTKKAMEDLYNGLFDNNSETADDALERFADGYAQHFVKQITEDTDNISKSSFLSKAVKKLTDVARVIADSLQKLTSRKQYAITGEHEALFKSLTKGRETVAQHLRKAQRTNYLQGKNAVRNPLALYASFWANAKGIAKNILPTHGRLKRISPAVAEMFMSTKGGTGYTNIKRRLSQAFTGIQETAGVGGTKLTNKVIEKGYIDLIEGRNTPAAKAVRDYIKKIRTEVKRQLDPNNIGAYGMSEHVKNDVPFKLNHAKAEKHAKKLRETLKSLNIQFADQMVEAAIGNRDAVLDINGPEAWSAVLSDANNRKALAEFLDKNGVTVLNSYAYNLAHGAAKRMAFGAHARNLDGTLVRDDAGRVRFMPMVKLNHYVQVLNKEDADVVSDVIHAINGNYAFKSTNVDGTVSMKHPPQWLRRTMNITNMVGNMAVLGLAGITNIMDTAVPLMLSGDMGVSLRAIVSMLKNQDRKQIRQLAKTLGTLEYGVIQNTVMGLVNSDNKVENAFGKASGAFFTVTGMNATTRLSRQVAIAVAVEAMRTAARNPPKSDNLLYRSGLSIQEVQTALEYVDGDLNKVFDDTSNLPQDISQAVRKFRNGVVDFANNSTLDPNEVTDPIFAQNPWFQLVTNLKRFFYAYHQVVLKGLFDNAARRYRSSPDALQKLASIAQPLAMMVAFSLPLSLLQWWIREWLRDGDLDKGNPFDKPLHELVWGGFKRAGVLGLGDIIDNFDNAVEYGTPWWLAATPSLATAVKGGGQIADGEYGKAAKTLLPLYNKTWLTSEKGWGEIGDYFDDDDDN